MKKLFLLMLSGAMLSCTSEKAPTLSLTNSSELARTDEAIVLKRTELEKVMTFENEMLPVLVKSNGEFLACQIDDLDNDGKWDELFALIDLNGNEKLDLSVETIDAEIYPQPKARTNVRFANRQKDYFEESTAIREEHSINTITEKKWQMEGPAWENDKIGFRHYFDRRNGNDIFGKLVCDMVLDSVAMVDLESYHTLNPNWGMDILKVGNSLGAGAIAYEIEDSIYRVGDNGLGTYELLTEGPLRTVFRLEFHNWKANNENLTVINDIIIQAGKHYYESQTSYSGTEKDISLVTGIVNKKSKNLFEAKCNEAVKSFYSFDNQAEDGSLLGMGMMTKSENFKEIEVRDSKNAGITETYCMLMHSESEKINVFRFYAVWELQDKQWKTAEGFEELLRNDAELLKNGLIVELH